MTCSPVSVLAAFLLAVSSGLAAAADARPDLLLFLSDDHGWSYSGSYGHPVVRTPNIDRLAAEGMRFTTAFAGSATCSPSRAVIYSGLMPFRNGAFLNHSWAYPHVRTLPHYLQRLGYRVVLVHKKHYGPEKVYPYEYHQAALPRRADRVRMYRGEGVDVEAVAALLAEHAARPQRQPLCLVVAASGPHVNWQEVEGYDPDTLPLPPYMVDTPTTRQAMGRYLSDVTDTDRKLGAVLDALDAHGYADRMMTVYTSDQAAEWPHAKWNLYDAGIRVPLVVRFPGRVKPGSVSHAMVSLVDLLPTFLEVAGSEPVEGLDGRSFLDVLEGRANEHRRAVYASHSGDGTMNEFPMRCIRTATHKLILNLKPQNIYATHFVKAPDPDHGHIWDTWAARAEHDAEAADLIRRFQHRPEVELYDLQADPLEMHNLSANPAHASLVADLRWKLENWMATQGDRGIESEVAGHERQAEQMRILREAARRQKPGPKPVN